MGRIPLSEQREAAAVVAPDIVRRLARLETGEVEPRWVLDGRREVCHQVLRELAVVYARRVRRGGERG